MKTDEQQKLLAIVEQIRNLPTADHLAAQYPNADLAQVRFGPYSALDLVNLTDRWSDQISEALRGDDAKHLPLQFSWESYNQPLQQRSILTVAANYRDYLNGKNWETAAQIMGLAIGYLMNAGLWNKGTSKLYSVNKLRQKELFADLDTKARQLRELMTIIEKLRVDQAAETAKRQADAASANTQLVAAKKDAEEINSLLNKANGVNGQVTQILNTQKENLDAIATERVEIGKFRTEIETALTDTKSKLEESEKRLAHMEEKEDWVNELAGTAAAGVLGQKFEARMRQLSSASNWWLTGTVISVVLAGVWLGLSHKYFMVPGSDIWTTLALNFGLLLPALFIVGFFATQFGKVRQFEEEYAFRASVAMTLGAFADRLKDSNEDHNRLISETVEKLYKLPVLLQEKEQGASWFQQKSVERTLKSAVELVKEVKTPPNGNNN